MDKDKIRNIAIIPARGGSKRIPRKNIKDFLGKPIIAYSIINALESKLFDDVIVSTDDTEIAEISKAYGANIPFYREKTHDDFSTLSDVLSEVKQQLSVKNIVYDNICLILPTAPLIMFQDLVKSYNLFISKDADVVFPAVRYSYPIQRSFKLNNGIVNYLWPKFYKTRSQDLEPVFHDAGLYYWIKRDKNLDSLNKYAYELPEIKAQDVDNESDWKLCELKYKLLKIK